MHRETSRRGSVATPALPISTHRAMKAMIPTTAKIAPAVATRGKLFPLSGVLLMTIPKFEFGADCSRKVWVKTVESGPQTAAGVG